MQVTEQKFHTLLPITNDNKIINIPLIRYLLFVICAMNLQKLLVPLLEKHDLDPSLLEVPSDRTMGDLAYPCFTLAKKFKKSTQQIASDLTTQMKVNHPVQKILATGPYLNFFFDGSWIAEQVIEDIIRA